MSDEEFRDLICENLACRLSDGEDCSKTMDHFLERCFYVPVRRLGRHRADHVRHELTARCCHSASPISQALWGPRQASLR